MDNVKKDEKKRKTGKEIEKMVGKLTPLAQMYVLNTIVTFLYAQEISEEESRVESSN